MSDVGEIWTIESKFRPLTMSYYDIKRDHDYRVV